MKLLQKCRARYLHIQQLVATSGVIQQPASLRQLVAPPSSGVDGRLVGRIPMSANQRNLNGISVECNLQLMAGWGPSYGSQKERNSLRGRKKMASRFDG